MKKIWTLFYFVMLLMLCRQHALMAQGTKKPAKPFNILFAIADDQSYPHASAYGQKTFHTPVFDSIAANGILFNNAFVAAPQCSPSRAAILTGRHIWQLEEAGTHASLFPKKFPVFTGALENEGYFIGYTGKAWAPGNFADAGWTRNPVGPGYNTKQFSSVPAKGISKTDYAANFKIFLSEKPSDKPFFFWYGANEPHRNYEKGSGAAAGLTDEGLIVPPFLPDDPLVKNDMLDYALEIEWFDKQLGKMLQLLAEAGELERTIIVVTADNGMPFPYAKANLQEYGIHVPLAICGPIVKGKPRKSDELVSLIDLAPTFLDIAGAKHFAGITGKTLMPVLTNSDPGKIIPVNQYILAGRERHTHARPDNVGYPARAIRTTRYLYIENFKPDRWPMGDPAPLQQIAVSGNADMKPILLGYEDIDDSPTKSFMVRGQSELPERFRLGFKKRGSSELYDIQTDPYCLHDLSSSEDMQAVCTRLKKELEKKLTQQGDPRMTGNGDIFDSYPRFGLMRPFEGFKERGKYNPAFIQSSFARNNQSPNIILILTDDLGWSCFSAKMDDRIAASKSDYYETPNIDRLIAQSMRFTRGYAPDPICSPSRRSIQFGQTSIRQGDESFPARYNVPGIGRQSIPGVLKAFNSQYKAAHFGKWDLRAGITPEQLGYDESDGDTGNKTGDLVKDKNEKWTKHYITGNPKQMDSITARAVRFMQEQVKAKHPFYLQVSHYATHVNFESRQSSYDKFKSKKPGSKHTNPAWAAMIYDLDASIGELLNMVDRLGIANNTYIFLMADNGAVEFIPPVRNRLDPPSSFPSPMTNYPLRGGKWTLYEGGIRVPFIAKGPGIKAGAQSDVPVAGWDLLPTFNELAGNTKKPGGTLDGGSLVPVLKHGGKGEVTRLSNDFFFHRYNNSYPHSAIIAGGYKLIKFWKTNKTELYNIGKDPGEVNDLSNREVARAKEMERRLLTYINEVNPELAKRY